MGVDGQGPQSGGADRAQAPSLGNLPIELTPLDTYTVIGLEIPRAAVTNGFMLIFNLIFVLAFYKELKITSFDPALATTIGINADLLHYSLMSLVAASTIAAFESVGSILVIAMLIVPGATAHLLTDRLSVMLGVSLVVAALAAALGHLGAITVPLWFGFQDTSTAGMMAVAAGGLFVMVFLFAPRYGVVSRLIRQACLTLKIIGDDILGLLFRFQEMAPAGTPPMRSGDFYNALKQTLPVRLALWVLTRRRWVRPLAGGYELTAEGLRQGRSIVRSHRLWESFFCDKMNYCATDVHTPAHHLEHFTDSAMQTHLEEVSRHPGLDPHRRHIPK
jgi:manganese/zinc/iron transport system permease protein